MNFIPGRDGWDDAPRQSVAPIGEFRALLRTAAFRRVDPRRIQGRDASIVLLGALLLLAWTFAEPLLKTRELAFWPYSLPNLAWVVAGTFVLAWMLARLSRPAIAYRRVLLVTLSALPLAIVGSLISGKLVGAAFYAFTGALAVYALAYVTFALRTLSGRAQWRAVIAGALVAAGFIWSLSSLRVNPSLWIRADEKLDAVEGEGAAWQRMARVQFVQQARIDAELAAVKSHATAAPETFFLGFGGYGQQQIFANEIELASRVVDARFDVDARALRLVNDQSDLERWPLASEAALRYSLQRLGEIMGDDDVLFLALSSHGEKQAAIKVTNAGQVPARLRASALADMLRESGIRWRVIVVSACYSGSFVDALANDHTIVIAAAAADRKSFGCNDRRRITHFGEAFYGDALPKAASLRAAFDAARISLETQEQQAGITPSLPQAKFGTALESKLTKMGTFPISRK